MLTQKGIGEDIESCERTCEDDNTCAAWSFTNSGGSSDSGLCAHFPLQVEQGAWIPTLGWRVRILDDSKNIVSEYMTHFPSISRASFVSGEIVVEGFYQAPETGNYIMRWMGPSLDPEKSVSNITIFKLPNPNSRLVQTLFDHESFSEISDVEVCCVTDKTDGTSPSTNDTCSCSLPLQKHSFYYIKSVLTMASGASIQPALFQVKYTNVNKTDGDFRVPHTSLLSPPDRTHVSWGCWDQNDPEYSLLAALDTTSQIVQRDQEYRQYTAKYLPPPETTSACDEILVFGEHKIKLPIYNTTWQGYREYVGFLQTIQIPESFKYIETIEISDDKTTWVFDASM